MDSGTLFQIQFVNLLYLLEHFYNLQQSQEKNYQPSSSWTSVLLNLPRIFCWDIEFPNFSFKSLFSMSNIPYPFWHLHKIQNDARTKPHSFSFFFASETFPTVSVYFAKFCSCLPQKILTQSVRFSGLLSPETTSHPTRANNLWSPP